MRAGALDDAGLHIGIAHPAHEGETILALIARRGARHFNEALPLLWAITEALAPLHAAGLVHGSLHAGNVLVTDPTPSAPKVLLLDPGSYFLRPALTPSAAKRQYAHASCFRAHPSSFAAKRPARRAICTRSAC